MMPKNMIRRQTAKIVCRYLPPRVSEWVREIIYPWRVAIEDGYEKVVRSQSGSLFKASTNDIPSHRFIVHGYFNWLNIAIARALVSAGDCIIEIGVNIGTETIGFSDIVGAKGKVYAFEPVQRNLRIIKENIKLNNKQNIILYPFAISNCIKKKPFVIFQNDYAIGYLLNTKRKEPNSGITEVDCKTLDSFLNEISKPRIIYIDVEGEELLVLHGGKKFIQKYHPILVLEASAKLIRRAGFTLNDLKSQIENLDYVPYKITRLGLRQIEESDLSLHSDWICIPKTEDELLVKKISRFIKKCALLPCIPGLNPITKR